MAQQFVIPSVFEAIDRMSPAMAIMTRNVTGFGNAAEVAVARGERAFRRAMAPINALGNKFNNVMGGLGAPVGFAALGYAAKETTDIFIEFGNANSKVAAGLDMTLSQIKPLTDDAKRLGATTKFTAVQVSDLQFEYAKLGFAPDQIREMTKSTLDLAAATEFELGPAATTVGAALRAYGLEADQTGRVSNVLAASASKTALDMQDFYENLSTFAPVARAFNFSLEDSVALFGKIRDAGFDASSAATALRNIFLNLADGNGKLAQALGKPAQTLPELLHGMINLRDAGVDLATMLEITDKRSVAAFATLLNGAESVGKLADELHRADGFAQKMANTQLDNVKGSLTLMKAAWEGWVLSIDDGTNEISQGIRHVSAVFTEMFQIMSGTAKANYQLNETERHVRATAESMLFWGEIAIKATAAVLAFKAALIVSRIALTAMNIAIGIGNALFTTSTVLTYENVVAQKAYLMTSRAVSIALEVMSGNFAVLNATMLANPAFLLAAGLAAIAASLYLISQRQEELLELYKRKLELDTAREIELETSNLKKLVAEYWNLGQSIHEATANAIKFENTRIGLERAKVESRITMTKMELEREKNKLYVADLFSGIPGYKPMVGRRDELAQQLAAQQETAKGLAADKSSLAMFARSALDNGTINQSDLGNTFNRPVATQSSNPFALALQEQQRRREFRVFEGGTSSSGGEYVLTIKNDSANAVKLEASGKSGLDVMPNTKSTTVMDKK